MNPCPGLGGLSTEAALSRVQTIMRGISEEVSKDCRARMREEREAELADAMQEADELDAKASCQETGGWVAGGLTVAGGALVIGGQIAADGGAPSQDPKTGAKGGDSASETAAVLAEGGDILKTTADPASRLAGAAETHHEAASRRASARSNSHASAAQEAKDAADAAKRAAESCTTAYRTVMDTYHQGMMAILARR